MHKFLLVFLFLLLLSPAIFAIEFNLDDSFKQGETILVKISGTFVSSFSKSNVLFYKDHYQVPVDFDLLKLNGEYYLSASLEDKLPGNYSIHLQNIQYNKGATLSNEEIIEPFIITNETAIFSVNPGAFLVNGDSFFIEVKNLFEETSKIDVSLSDEIEGRELYVLEQESLEKKAEFSLISGASKKIYFKLNNGEASFQKIKISSENTSYEIPVYALSSENSAPSLSVDGISLEPYQAFFPVPLNTVSTQIFRIYNKGTSNLTNISIEVSESLASFTNLSISKVESMKANSILPIEVTFFSPIVNQIEGTITVDAGNKRVYSKVSVNFSENASESKSIEYSQYNCTDIGTACEDSIEVCSEEPVYSMSGLCCLGSCDKIPDSSSSKKIIAICILLVIVTVVGWFYFKKFKGAKKPVNLLEVAKGK